MNCDENLKPIVEESFNPPRYVIKLNADSLNDESYRTDLNSILDKIIIGPSNNSSQNAIIMTNALKTAGVSDVNNKVLVANIPIRV